MLYKIKKVYLLLFFVFSYVCFGDHKVYFMEAQRSMVDYYDPNYFQNLTYTSARYKRDNPIYFQTIRGKIMKFLDNSVKINIYIYELLSNVYKRSFIEVHSGFCDFMNVDNLFSRSIKSTNYKPVNQCPLPPGDYRLDNMTTPYGPFLKSFPFKQGRVYINITKGNKDLVTGHTDIRIKEVSAKDYYKYLNNEIN